MGLPRGDRDDEVRICRRCGQTLVWSDYAVCRRFR